MPRRGRSLGTASGRAGAGPEVGRGRSQAAGTGPKAGSSPSGSGGGSRLRTGVPGRGCARAVLGPWRAESRRAPAEGGGGVAREAGAPLGSGRDAECCESDGKAARDVTRGSSPQQRSLGP